MTFNILQIAFSQQNNDLGVQFYPCSEELHDFFLYTDNEGN